MSTLIQDVNKILANNSSDSLAASTKAIVDSLSTMTVKNDTIRHAEIIISVRDEMIVRELDKIRNIIDNFDVNGSSYISLSIATDLIKTLICQRQLAVSMIKQETVGI